MSEFKELLAEQMKDEEFRKEYEALEQEVQMLLNLTSDIKKTSLPKTLKFQSNSQGIVVNFYRKS